MRRAARLQVAAHTGRLLTCRTVRPWRTRSCNSISGAAEYGSSLDDLQISSVDLVDEVGGEAIVGPVMTWIIDPATTSNNPRHVAGLSASGDVLLWRVLADDMSWSFINLTQSVDGARPIVSELFNTGEITSNYVATSGGYPVSTIFQTLAGFDADGNFVAY